MNESLSQNIRGGPEWQGPRMDSRGCEASFPKYPGRARMARPKWQRPRMIQADASASLFMFLFLAQRLDLDRFLHQCVEIISGLVFQAFVDRVNQCFVVLLDRDTDVDLFF